MSTAIKIIGTRVMDFFFSIKTEIYEIVLSEKLYDWQSSCMITTKDSGKSRPLKNSAPSKLGPLPTRPLTNSAPKNSAPINSVPKNIVLFCG